MQQVEVPAPRLTVEQWFSNPFVQILATSESLGWNNVTVRSAALNATTDFYPGPFTDEDHLHLLLRGATYLETHGVGGLSHNVPSGSLMIYPRQSEQLAARWDSPVAGFLIALSRKGIVDNAASIVHGDPERIEMQLLVGFHDPLLRSLATELYNELHNRNLFGPLFAESVSNTIILHLLRNYSNVRKTYQIKEGKLTPAQRQIVEEYIQEHLDQKITLADLANCIHVSVPHFEKMFRATLHCSPYQYVLERKIEKAKLLLSDPQLSLYEVARQCGFANQSHFTKHFTKFVGVSPARFVRGMST